MTMPPMMNGPPPQHPLCAAAAPVMAPPPLKPQQMTSQPGIIHLPQGALKPEVPPARMAPPVAAPVAGPVAGGVLAVDNNAALPKEKTPMCLVNELARFNKVLKCRFPLSLRPCFNIHRSSISTRWPTSRARRTKRRFSWNSNSAMRITVPLAPASKKVEWALVKPIKGWISAQHAAADYALQHTKYKHPTPKPRKVFSTVELDYSSLELVEWNLGLIFARLEMVVTPTVELNTLAMKRGEQTVYKALEAPRSLYPPPNLDFRGIYHQR